MATFKIFLGGFCKPDYQIIKTWHGVVKEAFLNSNGILINTMKII